MVESSGGVTGLIDQNIQAAELLTVNAIETQKSAEIMRVYGTHFNEVLTSGRDSQREALTALNAELATIDTQLEAEAARAAENLQTMMQSVQEGETKLAELAQAATAQLDLLKSNTEQIASFVETMAEQSQTQITELQSQTEEFTSLIGTQVEESVTQSTSLGELIESTRTALETSQSELTEQFGQLKEGVGEKLDELLANLGEFTEAADEKLKSLQGELDTVTAQTWADVDTEFVEELKSKLEESATSLNDALGELGTAAEKGKELVDGASGDVLGKIEDVVEIIEPIKDVLKLVESL